ncbi:hypothetical protein ACBJ59_52560 [Nonomuraea sp. MTCD27]|uniref:hypothetical protein n=1 Tax=Nonomuraea sp. MTCD27 TaxID=1676747 RepID=UPI0035BF1B56
MSGSGPGRCRSSVALDSSPAFRARSWRGQQLTLLWHDANASPHIATVVDSARRLAERLGWLEPAALPAGPPPGEDAPTATSHIDEPV